MVMSARPALPMDPTGHERADIVCAPDAVERPGQEGLWSVEVLGGVELAGLFRGILRTKTRRGP